MSSLITHPHGMAHDHATILVYRITELQSFTKQAAQRKDRNQHGVCVLNCGDMQLWVSSPQHVLSMRAEHMPWRRYAALPVPTISV